MPNQTLHTVAVSELVARHGYVEILAQTPEEAASVARRVGVAALNIVWTGATSQGPLKVGNVEAA